MTPLFKRGSDNCLSSNFQEKYGKKNHLKKLRCGDHIGETVMSLRLTMLFLKMSMTNSAHAFSHSLINS